MEGGGEPIFRWEVPRDITRQKINNHCRMIIMEEIQPTVDKYNLRRFIERSPFGHFFRFLDEEGNLKEQQFPGNLVLRVLALEIVMEDQRQDEMWFQVGGSAHRFGSTEFALVTGLHFGQILKADLELDGKELGAGNLCSRLWPNSGGNVRVDQVLVVLDEVDGL